MAIRTNEKSNSRLGRLRDRIRSTLFAGRNATADDAVDHESAAEQRPTNPDAPGNLFHCSTCGNVYIDSEKSSCTACEEDVEQVSSTLESSPVRH